MKITRKVTIWSLIVVILFAAVAWRGFARRRNRPGLSTDMIAVAERGDLEVKVSGSGTLAAGVREDVRTPLSGSIGNYSVEEGRLVSAGEVLAELDVQDMGLQIERKRLDIEIQERELNKIYEEKTNAILTASRTGEINWNVQDGDRVQSGSVIASVTDREYIEVAGRFNSSDIASIKNGQTAKFYLPDYFLEFSGQVADVYTVPRPGKPLPSLTAYYEVKAEFDNTQNLPDGVKGRMSVSTQSGKHQAAQPAALHLPEAADIRAPLSGTVTKFHVNSGTTVTEGRQIADIIDPQLDNQIATVEARLRQYELELTDLLMQSADEIQIQKLQLEINNLNEEIYQLYEKRASENLTAPAKGALQWNVREGDRVQEGSIIATVQSLEKVNVLGIFSKEQVGSIAKGQVVELYIAEYGMTVQGKVSEVGSVPKTGVEAASLDILYDVKVTVKNPGNLDANMAGVLKIATTSGEKTSVEAVSAIPESSLLRAPVTGTISTLVNSGRVVNGGQSLAEISDPDRAEQLKHQIATAELRLRQARLDLEETIQQQNDRFSKAVISAPIDGTLLLPSQTLGSGSDVSQGTILATIVDYSKMQVVIPVDELDVARVFPGQPVRVTAHALPDTIIEGYVLDVAQEGVGQGGVSVFDVTVAIEAVDGLRAGMSVNADILVESLQDILLVPIEAVVSQGGRSIVLIPDSDGQTRPEVVETGINDASHIQIVSGLNEGQQIIIQGRSALSGMVPATGGLFGGGLSPGSGGNRTIRQMPQIRETGR